LTISPAIFKRQSKLISMLEKKGLDAIALNPGPSLPYLTGLHFHLNERPVVVIFSTKHAPVIVLPELESAKLQEPEYPLEGITYGEDPSQWHLAFEKGLKSCGVQRTRIGLEPRSMRVLELRLLEQAAPLAEFIPADDVTAALRMFKDEAEISAMQKAAKIAQQALQATLHMIKIGVAEKEIAAELSMQLLRSRSALLLEMSLRFSDLQWMHGRKCLGAHLQRCSMAMP